MNLAIHAFAPLVLGLTLVPREEPQDVPARRTARAEVDAFLSVDRKYSSGADLGLYLRTTDGTMEKVWDGEPYDCRALPDKSVLIVERWEHRILWLTPEGEVKFRMDGFARPTDIELSADGHVLVVEHDRGCVTAIDPESRSIVYRRTGFRDPFDCAPLPDGGMLVADSGNDRIVKVDREGNQSVLLKGLDHPNTVELLDDGGTLVTNWTYGEVLDYDAHGKLRLHIRTGGVLYRAVRQLDGTTLCCDGTGRKILIYDERGRLLKTERFSPGCVDYEPIMEG